MDKREVEALRTRIAQLEAARNEAWDLLHEWAIEGHCPHTQTEIWLNANEYSAPETEPKPDQWVQDGKVFEEDADRCRNMAHKRYNMFNCTECDTSNRAGERK
jgi:hypothetical protein